MQTRAQHDGRIKIACKIAWPFMRRAVFRSKFVLFFALSLNFDYLLSATENGQWCGDRRQPATHIAWCTNENAVINNIVDFGKWK